MKLWKVALRAGSTDAGYMEWLVSSNTAEAAVDYVREHGSFGAYDEHYREFATLNGGATVEEMDLPWLTPSALGSLRVV